MFNIGGQELALIIVLALVVVGPEQLPGLIRKLGQYAAQAREMSSGLRAEFMAATEPMQDTFKEFQEGMNEFQSGMTDLSKTVTDAADVNQWGAGTAKDPIVPRGYAETQSKTSPASAEPVGADNGGRPDPWAEDRVQPITEPPRAKKLEVTPPVNPWDPIHTNPAAGVAASNSDPNDLGSESVQDQTEAAARQLEAQKPSATAEPAAQPRSVEDADEESA